MRDNYSITYIEQLKEKIKKLEEYEEKYNILLDKQNQMETYLYAFSNDKYDNFLELLKIIYDNKTTFFEFLKDNEYIYKLKDTNKILKNRLMKYNTIFNEVGIQCVEDINDLKNENDILRNIIYGYEKNIKIMTFSNISNFPDYYTIYLLSETDEEKEQRIKKQKEEDYKLCLEIYKKNILKNKLINIFKELSLNPEKIKKEKEEKENLLRKKIRLNQIKYKCRRSLIKLNEDSLLLYKLIDKIKKNKKIIFENINIHQSAVNIDRSMIKFLSDLYEEKEIKKTLSNKDFMLAVNEFHSDKNSTRMNHLCKIMYNLRKNDIIWNSSIIFKHIYSFQYIKEYQIHHLINHIETILTT